MNSKRRVKPAYFQEVQQEAHARWDMLEADPILAAPWLQLFRQVQSPRHVLSELLQNADDAGAHTVTARIFDDSLHFSHDGRDFTEEQFQALCRFGSSNKRRLHTIGFRGVGFKSTFSLGKVVRVITPTLAVEFNARRFSDPCWLDTANDVDTTTIIVPLADAERHRALVASMEQWTRSPESLLFFSNVMRLHVQEHTIERKRLGDGPVPRSERIELRGAEAGAELLVLHSLEEPFPPEAVAEIQEERGEMSLELPPCTVDLVLRSPDPGRVFVVLPTDVQLRLPVSLNGPFVQDPARTGLKSTSQSPTNRWLLQRAGKLIAETLKTWLANTDLGLDGRASAYEILPDVAQKAEGAAAECDACVRAGLVSLENASIALASDGSLVSGSECVAPPQALQEIWTAEDLLKAMGAESCLGLAPEVSAVSRRRLAQWGAVRLLSNEDALVALGRNDIAKPRSWRDLAALWQWVQSAIAADYSGEKRRALRIVPVAGAVSLSSASSVVRLPLDAAAVGPAEWDFLLSMIRSADRSWLAFLSEDSSQVTPAERDLLRVLGLERATPGDLLAQRAYDHLLTNPNAKDLLRLTRLIATLGATVPPNFQYATRDGELRSVEQGLAFDPDGWLSHLLPSTFVNQHVLHEDYDVLLEGGPQKAWEWVRSAKSRLIALPILEATERQLYGQSALTQLARERGVAASLTLQRQTRDFRVRETQFRSGVVAHLEETAKQDDTIWAHLVRRMLDSPPEYWIERLVASARQVTGYGNSFPVGLNDLPQSWLAVLRGQPCLFDTHGKARVPCELLVRSAQTAPMNDLEHFVEFEADSPANRPLLLALGARDVPADPAKLVDRIRAVAAQSPDSALQEVLRRYAQLDSLFSRLEPRQRQDLAALFASEALLLTEDMEWKRSSEVVQNRGDFDVEALSVLHPIVRGLPLWTGLGVADRPSEEFILAWLAELPTGTKLDPGDLRRVRSAIQASPVAIWSRCQHWLALDGSWTPCDSLKYRISMHGLVAWSGLFQGVKLSTADMRMLSQEMLARDPFLQLKELGAGLSTQVTEVVESDLGEKRMEWLVGLAAGLVRLKDTDEEVQGRVRSAAERLRSTRWVSFRRLSVTPMIEGVQAGLPFSPGVLWSGQTLYVADKPMAVLVGELAAELARPFATEPIAEAIKHCVARDAAFVAEHLCATFELEPEELRGAPESSAAAVADASALSVSPSGAENMEPDVVIVVATANGDPGAESGTASEEPEEPAGPPEDRARAPTASVSGIDAYARTEGYKLKDKRYVRADGACLERNGAFGWDNFAPDGRHLGRYWVGSNPLCKGVLVPGEVWMILESEPDAFFLLVPDGNGNLLRYSGAQLMTLKKAGAIEVSAGDYRLRLVDEGGNIEAL